MNSSSYPYDSSVRTEMARRIGDFASHRTTRFDDDHLRHLDGRSDPVDRLVSPAKPYVVSSDDLHQHFIDYRHQHPPAYPHETYHGPTYLSHRQHLARNPSFLDSVDCKSPYHRLHEDLRSLDHVTREDFSQPFRYPYTSAYLHNSNLPSIDRHLQGLYHDTYCNSYYDMLHKHGSYHHRLDPYYLRNFHTYNSYYPYVYRRSEPFARDGIYDTWLKEVQNRYRHPLDSSRRFSEHYNLHSLHNPDDWRDASKRERILDTTPLYLTPSRLYDNPDYRDLRRKSNPR